MSFRKIVTGLAFAGAMFSAVGAQAGDTSTPNTTNVFTPGAASVVAAVFVEASGIVQSGGTLELVTTVDGGTSTTLPSGTTVTVSADGDTFTITPAGGAPITVTSSFVSNIISGYF